jgi:hypothetical protein
MELFLMSEVTLHSLDSDLSAGPPDMATSWQMTNLIGNFS